VDFETQERTPKASAHWYSSVVRQNALVPPALKAEAEEAAKAYRAAMDDD